MENPEPAAAPAFIAPKTAHATLADAVDRLFACMESNLVGSVDDAMGQLDLARRNYRLAEKVATDVSFGAVVARAVTFLDEGNTEGVRKCLNVLNLAADYVPLVDVSRITAAGDGG